MHTCVCLPVGIAVSAGADRGWSWQSSLALELQVVVSCLNEMLEAKLRPRGGQYSALSH